MNLAGARDDGDLTLRISSETESSSCTGNSATDDQDLDIFHLSFSIYHFSFFRKPEVLNEK
jgi:hypothetical protein